MRWQGFIDRRPWEISTRLYIVGADDRTGARVRVAPLVMTAIEPGVPVDEATLTDFGMDSLSSDGNVRGFLKAMMDLAWAEGIRPEGFEDQKNELSAVRYHLEDMRRMAKVPGAIP